MALGQSPSIAVACQCGTKIAVPLKYAGKQVKCPKCAQPVQVPSADKADLLHVWQGTISPEQLASGDPGHTYKPSRAPAPKLDKSAAADEYTLLEEIGKGGMGIVYRARQEALLREVAIKKVRPEAAQSENHFLSEAMVTGFLDHPNIVPVHELGKDKDGRLYLAMKLVQGLPWKKLLHPDSAEAIDKAAKLDLEGQLRILLAVCNAVAFAHSKGIIHRDLKPDNIMVGDYGEVLVMDWGIALDVRERPAPPKRTEHRTGVTTPAGTPSYMAPEMAEMASERFGPWTDVYLLGAILHEILTGQPANEGQGPQECMINALLPKERKFPPGVADELQDICRKALALSPGDRYQAVEPFREDIEAHLKHRESLLITEKADQEAAELAAVVSSPLEGEGRVRGQAAHQELYARYAKVVARYEQALELWPGNDKARAGVRAARLAYAQAALAAGDLGLAEAQLASQREEDAAAAEQLQQQVQAARLRIVKRERTARLMRTGLCAAAALIFLGVTVAYFWIRSERNVAQTERTEAQNQRDLADTRLIEVARQKEETEQQRAEAQHQRDRAQQQRLAAESAQELAEKRLTEVQRQTEEASRQTEEASRQKEKAELAGKMSAGANYYNLIARAGQLKNEELAQIPVDVRGWEWGRIMYLRQLELQLHTLKGHEEQINAVAYSPDGKLIITAAGSEYGQKDNTTRIWDAETGEQKMVLSGDRGPRSREEAEARKNVPSYMYFPHSNAVTAVTFSSDGKLAVTGSMDQTSKIWNVETGQIVRTLAIPKNSGPQERMGHAGAIHVVVFSPDSKRVVTWATDKIVKIWNADNGALIATLKRKGFDRVEIHDTGYRFGDLPSISFSTDGKQFITCGGTKDFIIWDAAVGTEIAAFQPPFSPQKVSYLPGGKTLLVAGTGKIVLWDIATASVTKTLYEGIQTYDCALSTDGKRLAVLSNPGDVSIKDVETGKWIISRMKHVGPATGMAFSPNGSRVTIFAGKVAKICDAETDREFVDFKGHAGSVVALAFSPDSRLIATGSSDNTALIREVNTGRIVRMLAGHADRINVVAFSPDGQLLATGSDDESVKIWDVNTGKERVAFIGHKSRYTGLKARIKSLSFAPDGTRVLSGASTDNDARVWNVATGQQVFVIDTGEGVEAVAFAPDGARFVTAGGSAPNTAVKIWESTTGAEVRTIRWPHPIGDGLVFSPDGKQLAVDSIHGATVYDLAAGKVIFQSKFHGSVSFSPDGRRILIGQECCDSLTGHSFMSLTGSVRPTAFSPDGLCIAVGWNNNSMRIYKAIDCRK